MTDAPRTDDAGPASGLGSATELRRILEAELAASNEAPRQAILLYELGSLEEREGHEAEAVRDYLQSYNRDPDFRPPLFALIALFERRRSTKNLLRLYDAEAKSATEDREVASALADKAATLIDHLGDDDGGLAQLAEAVERAPDDPALALLLEHERRAHGDVEGALEAVLARAELTADPVLASLLRLEVGLARERAGDVDGALSMLRSAVTTPAARWRVLHQLERVARRHRRHPELVVALEGRAKLAAADARGEDKGQASGAFSVPRFVDRARAAALGAALYREAARLRVAHLGDVSGALRDLEEGIALVGDDDPLLRHDRMLACELLGDVDQAGLEADRLLALGVEGAYAAALHFRRAERAQAAGDRDEAVRSLQAATLANADGAVAAATLEDLLAASGEVEPAIDAILARARAGADDEARSRGLWEAAQLARDTLGDLPRAAGLYLEAAEASADPVPILRELWAAAARGGDLHLASTALERLLDEDLEDGERGALLLALHDLHRHDRSDPRAAVAVLWRALEAPAATPWAPDLARLYGATEDEGALLAQGHQGLAARAGDAETAAAHLCAAARALVRAGRPDEAIAALRDATARSPGHPYAVALLEAVLGERGDAEAVAKVLREAADASDTPRAVERRLLLAGAAAEAAGDTERAAAAYREAAERVPTSVGPAFALLRLAESQRNDALLGTALEALAARERERGEPGAHSLALGEYRDLVQGDAAGAAEALTEALSSGEVALQAAVDLALLGGANGTGEARLEGLRRLTAGLSGALRTVIDREVAGTALLGKADIPLAEATLDRLAVEAPGDPWAQLALLRLRGAQASRAAERPARWQSLAEATDDPVAAAQLTLQGLRARVALEGAEALDDAVLVAHEVAASVPDDVAAALALDETLGPGDDPDARARVLAQRLEGTDDPAARLSLELALGRTLVAAGRSREALEVLLRVAAADNDDLASWEAIRVAAREAEAWEPLVEACDRLAQLLDDPELRMALWEESAAVLMDELAQSDRAERRLRRVLALDARRPVAFGRLHDLLAEHGDEAGLLELVSDRIEILDDGDELARLYYEQARLLRSLGLREEALGALENLLLLDEEHVGGLALRVELLVQDEQWAPAVGSLQALARARDVPASQRRIARLGAADFLEHRLQAPEEALAELEAVEAMGRADRALHERMASLAEDIGDADRAVAHLAEAVRTAEAPEVIASLERRMAALHEVAREDHGAAIEAYSRALAAAPTDLDAAEAATRLLDDMGRQDLSDRFAAAVRGELYEDPTDPEALRRLARAGRWVSDGALEGAALSVLVALGQADPHEASLFEGLRRPTPDGPPLDNLTFSLLIAPGFDDPALHLARAVAPGLAAVDGTEPSAFGAGRGTLVQGADPLLEELAHLATLLGAPAGALHRGGDDAGRLELLPYAKGGPAWLLGPAVGAPLSPEARFVVGRLAFGLRFGVAPFVRRGPEAATTAVLAAAVVAGHPLPRAEGRDDVAELARRLSRALPRRTRKSLAPLVEPLLHGWSVTAWTQALHRSADRVGVLLAGDVGPGLRRLLDGPVVPEVVRASKEARLLLDFWLSAESVNARRRWWSEP